MSVSQTISVATILREHVTLEVESIDRMYLNVYVPLLQRAAGVVGVVRHQRGATFASAALMEPISHALPLSPRWSAMLTCRGCRSSPSPRGSAKMRARRST